MSNNMNILASRDELRTALSIDRIAGITSIILGHPGIGKTEVVEQVGADTAVLPMGYVLPENHVPKVVGFYASQMEGTDITGYPVLSKDGESLEFKVMHKLRSLQSGDTLIIDEFTLADEGTLKPCLQLLSGDRPRVNDWEGAPHVTRIGMGNLADSGNLGFVYNPVLGNRVAAYEYLGPTVDEWLEYALLQGVHPAILTAIKMEGQSLLLDWNPSRDRNPTHRSWFNASAKLLAAESMMPEGVPMPVRLSQLASCVGDPAALQVETLLHLQDKIVPYATVVASPDTAPVPDGYDDPAAQFLMATHVANRCEPDHWASVSRYIARFPIELQATIINPIVARYPALMSTPEYANSVSRSSNLK